MALETEGQRLTMSETTLNVQGSPGTEGGYGQVRENLLGQRGDMARSGTTSWDRGEIEGNTIPKTTLDVQGSLICVR